MWLTFRSGVDEGRSVEVAGDVVIVGRDPASGLAIEDARVSRRHAALRPLEGGRIELADLSSANGTFVNGVRIAGPTILSGDERLRFGDTTLVTSARPLSGSETMVGAPLPRGGDPPPPPPPPPQPSGPSPSVIERVRLRRTTRAAVVAAAAAVVIAVAAVVLALTGTFGGGDDGPAEASIPEIVDAVRPSTVVINSLVDGGPAGSGTGWVLDAEQGLIVTNQHVTNAGTSFTVGVDDAQRPATLIAAAPCEDLALLQVEDRSGLVTLPLGSQADLRQGQTVVAVGFPGTASERANLVPTTGVVSVIKTRFDLAGVDVPQYPNVIQTDAVINPGNSGGPLVDTHARLVGVNSAGITLLGDRAIQGQGYAIGVDRVKEIVPRLRSGRSIGYTGMGIVHVTDPSALASQLASAGLPAQAGLVVVNAVPGTPAAAAGFGERPTLITAVNGRPMDGSLPSYCSAISNGEGGSSATFTVAESGSPGTRDVSVDFG